MKTQKLLIILIVTYLFYQINTEKAGVKLAIKQESVQEAERRFLPLAIKKLGTINIENQSMDVDLKISKLHIDLINIQININKLLAENIDVSFTSPNFIDISARDIEGSGKFTATYKLSIYKETDDVTIRVNYVNVNSRIELMTVNAPNEPGKLLPSGRIADLKVDLDFDFDIHGSLVAKFLTLVKDVIKKKIKNIIVDEVRKQIVNKSEEIISNLVKKLPVYVPLGKNLSLAVDYSLLSNPKVENGYLIINSSGMIVDLAHPESKNPPFPIPDNIPEYDKQGKNIQAFISDYSVNTAANSLFLADKLNLLITPKNLPEDVPFKLNTTSLNTLFAGMIEKYGDNKPVNIYCKSINAPFANILATELKGKLFEHCEIIVILDDGSKDTAYIFTTEITVSGIAQLSPNGIITGKINEIMLNNSKQIESKLEKADITVVEMLFNFAVKFAIPVINEKYLKKIEITIPIVEGISFRDSSLSSNDNYIEINLTPTFNNNYGEYIDYSIIIAKEKEDRIILLDN